VTSPLRAPFTVFEGTSGPAELAKDVRDGDGRLKTVGELISCPFCIGMWVSTGFTTGHIFMPRATRFAATTLAALAGSDFLPFAYAYAEQHAGWRTPAGAPRLAHPGRPGSTGGGRSHWPRWPRSRRTAG